METHSDFTNHYSSYLNIMLDTNSIQIIRDTQQKSIDTKTLVKEQLDLIYTKNWFNIWVPKEYGGLDYTFEQGLALLEELAYHDGGLAWTITLCSGANMFVGFIEAETAETVFANPKVCFGGSGKPNSKAIWDGKQYTISGKWSYATGAPHLTHFTLNAPIYDGDKARLDDEGNPIIFSFFIPRDQVLIHYDWNTFGLECTASHSFSLENVIAKEEQSFVLTPSQRHIDNPLFRIPFMPFAELTLLVNYLGMYRRFLSLTEKSFFDRSKDPVWAENFSKQRFKILDSLQQELEQFNTFVKSSAKRLWNMSIDQEIDANNPYLSEISTESKRIAKSIRLAVAEIIPLLGIHAAQLESETNIVFRNIFTATQHSLLNARS